MRKALSTSTSVGVVAHWPVLMFSKRCHLYHYLHVTRSPHTSLLTSRYSQYSTIPTRSDVEGSVAHKENQVYEGRIQKHDLSKILSTLRSHYILRQSGQR